MKNKKLSYVECRQRAGTNVFESQIRASNYGIPVIL